MILKMLKQLENEKMSSWVGRVLEASISELYLLPGQNISEEEIIKELSVSRTTVREALIKLSQNNLITIVPQKGTIINLINLKQINDFLFLRTVAEKEIVKKSDGIFKDNKLIELTLNFNTQEKIISLNGNNFYDIIELDNQFHQIIFEGYGMKEVWNILKSHQQDYNRLRYLGLQEKITNQTMLNQHEEYLEHIKNGNTEKLIPLIEAHLDGFERHFGSLVSEYPEYFQN